MILHRFQKYVIFSRRVCLLLEDIPKGFRSKRFRFITLLKPTRGYGDDRRRINIRSNLRFLKSCCAKGTLHCVAPLTLGPTFVYKRCNFLRRLLYSFGSQDPLTVDTNPKFDPFTCAIHLYKAEMLICLGPTLL